jgi:hypothetical protein
MEDVTALALAQQTGGRVDPPQRCQDNARYFAIEDWIQVYIRARVDSGLKTWAMSGIANWILDRIRPYANSMGYPKESRKYQRSFDKAVWIVFRRKACAERLGLEETVVKRLLDELVEIGLVESYYEKTKPNKDKVWYGPKTRVVRVRYELIRKVNKVKKAKKG